MNRPAKKRTRNKPIYVAQTPSAVIHLCKTKPIQAHFLGFWVLAFLGSSTVVLRNEPKWNPTTMKMQNKANLNIFFIYRRYDNITI
jgi:hypothetical protein